MGFKINKAGIKDITNDGGITIEEMQYINSWDYIRDCIDLNENDNKSAAPDEENK